jgi:dipeptidyl aminopeptidase/acylaminoacyl peptidase
MYSDPGGRRTLAMPDVPVRAMRRFTAGAAATALLFSCEASTAQGAGPSVREVVEFTRIVYPEARNVDGMQSHLSPDGTKAFIVTRTANTRTDRNRYRILLLDMRPAALASGELRPPVEVAAFDPELDNNSAYPAVQDVQWAGSGTLSFRARIRGKVFQAYRLDTASRRITQLTHSPTDVVSFAVSQDLRRVVYTAQLNNPPMAEGQRSVVVGSQSFWSVKFGQTDMRSQIRLYQHFVARSEARGQARRLGAPFTDATTAKPPVSISPDGRWALLPRYEPSRQLAWGQAYPLVREATARLGQGLGIDPRGYFTGMSRFVPRRLVAFRLSDGAQQPVVDAPDDTFAGPRPDTLWQRGGRSVIVAGTHLPLGAHGLKGNAESSHVIEYWPDAGRWQVVAELKGRLGALRAHRGSADAFAVTDDGGRRVFLRRSDGSWEEQRGDVATAVDRTAWSLRLLEDLDVPPDAAAEGPGGRTVRLTALNPQVSDEWGSMRPYAWKDPKGRIWDGGLMLPAGHTAGMRLPLVIQTYGFARNRFYLDGANASIGFTSGFAGRAFLREGIAVLAMPVRPSADAPHEEAAAIAAFMDGVRGAIEALVAEGMVDRERIGIMGWSMTGERVLNLVTFSDAPIRAASILDGDANTLFSLAVTYGRSDDIVSRKSKTNEGLPFGPARANWLRNDPSLHTECVKVAMRIETYGPWVLNNWDIYALLRQQYKPAEMVVIPGGSHGLMTPSERMLSLQGNVDWFSFWLRDRERAEPLLWGEDSSLLQDQYRRWREMAELKRADDARPACARRGG